ncbi:MAG: HAD-IIIC family phosphatase [Bacteroidia bacterium]|jgi:FkbH-like protein|nr:HAD-IIIC family phosphatase [Bacteroidia bacterium]
MENLKYTEILQLNKQLSGTISSAPYQIGILSNVTVNAGKEILEYVCRKNQIEPTIEIGNFDNIVQDAALFRDKNLVMVFWDTLNLMDQVSEFFEDLEEDTMASFKQKIYSELSMVFNNLSSTPSVIFNCFSSAYYPINVISESKTHRFVSELNRYVKENAPSNFVLMDIDAIFQQHGLSQCYDQRFYLSSKAPYTVNFLKHYMVSIEPLLLRNNGKLKKALILDCDNTLWQGIIGEDGLEGIDMASSSKKGVFFHKIQQMAVFLSKRGIIIGLCSKNNEADVLEALRTHKDAVLKEENIVIHKINWNDKAANLKAIAQELNIGTDSLVFIDDSDFEINLIREKLPEVHCIHVPALISDYPQQLLKNIYKLFNLNPNKDDLKKTEMYKQQFQRESAKDQFGSIDDYLASLGIELTVLVDDAAYIPRISQLTQKTNQFNLTTLRYTENQIEQFMEHPKSFTASMFVKDKFGDSGLTGVCILKEDEGDPRVIHIDSLLMSCRILGRNIEYVFLDHVIELAEKKGYSTIRAQFITTKKNAQVKDYYEKIGFELLRESEGTKSYSLNISTFKPRNIQYIKINTTLNV